MYSKDSKVTEVQIKAHLKNLGKDNVKVEILKNGKYRLIISRPYSRMHFNVDQKRPSTGLSLLNSEGKIDKANADVIAGKITQMHNDLAYGNFDKSLVKYGLAETPQLEVIDGGKKPEMSLLELYNIYCESRKGSVAETTLKLNLKGEYKHTIVKAVDAVGENALAIRNWLVENYSSRVTKECLRYLGKACQLGVKHGHRVDNPFDGMAEEIKLTKGKNKTQGSTDDDDEGSDARAFSVDEMNTIIDAFEESKKCKYLAPIIKFLFWTGCRTGEAIALKWRDIKWDDEMIVFRRNYSYELKIFKSTKTGVIRFFPMPKDGQLWNLLKSLPQGDSDDVVFKSRTGKIIHKITLWRTWAGSEYNKITGVIPTLIKEGKVKEYLKLYATRHTFISHQVNIHKIPITTVAQWVGNGAMVSNNSYLDRDKLTVPGYSYKPVNEPTGVSNDSKDNQTDNAMDEFVASLTPEQRERFKALLNK